MSFLFEETDAPFVTPDILMLLDLDDECWLAKESTLAAPKANKRGSQDQHAKLERKRKRPPTPRVRDKAKIELLRREVESLEAELDALQQSKQNPDTQPRKLARVHAAPVWKAIALRQVQERERAERRNEDLKRKLSEQHVLTMLLAGVLDEWPVNSFQGLQDSD